MQFKGVVPEHIAIYRKVSNIIGLSRIQTHTYIHTHYCRRGHEFMNLRSWSNRGVTGGLELNVNGINRILIYKIPKNTTKGL